jgi:delta(3,5)-delta(2,4)-dienoyl-CoA isomerase
MTIQHESEFMKIGFASPGVLHIQFARKPVNAFNEEFWREYGSIFGKLSTFGDVRVVVLSSAVPKFFTAGLDLHASMEGLQPQDPDGARRAFYFKEHIDEFQRAISAPERCNVPVICAIHGMALGLGIDISLACDVRFVASDASFSIKEVDIGLAADIGTLARGPKATGSSSLFAELALSARTFSAAEALRLGFASRVVEGSRDEVVKEALDLASLIASKSPVAVAGTKRLLLHARDHTVDSALEYTQIWNGAMLQTDDVPSAIEGFTKKKKPSFKPLRNAKL